MKSNKQKGNEYERETSKLLFSLGFWVHQIIDSPSGQPCDIIASKNNNTYLIECKYVSGSTFNMNRLEENQLNSINLFQDCGNNKGLVFIHFENNNSNIFITLDDLLQFKDKKTLLKYDDLLPYNLNLLKLSNGKYSKQ